MNNDRRFFLRGLMAAAVGAAVSSVSGVLPAAEVPQYGYGYMSSLGALHGAWNHVVIAHDRKGCCVDLKLNGVSTEDIAGLKVVIDNGNGVTFGGAVDDDLNLHLSQDFLRSLSIKDDEDYTVDFWFCLLSPEQQGVLKSPFAIAEFRIVRGIHPYRNEYSVVCDPSNNPPSAVAKGDLILDVYVEEVPPVPLLIV